MKQKFIEWFTKSNNGCSPAMEDDRSFVSEKTQHMFEAYQAGMAESERKVEQLAAENAALKQSEAEFDKMCAEDYGADWVSELTETPATDAILAEVRASGVEMFALMYAEEAIKSDSISIGWRARASKAASEYATQIRREAK